MTHLSSPRAIFLAAVIGLGAAHGAPALAQDSTLEGAQQEAIDGLGKLLKALDLFVKSVPQFAPPEMLPNGDIIIRRIHPDKKPAPEKPKPDDDATST